MHPHQKASNREKRVIPLGHHNVGTAHLRSGKASESLGTPQRWNGTPQNVVRKMNTVFGQNCESDTMKSKSIALIVNQLPLVQTQNSNNKRCIEQYVLRVAILKSIDNPSFSAFTTDGGIDPFRRQNACLF